jgi:hypothetical protein
LIPYSICKLSLFVIRTVGAAFERGAGRKKVKKVEIIFHGLGFFGQNSTL